MTIRNSAECFVNGVAVKSLAILGLASMFTACGDDSLDNISSRTQDGIQIVSEEGDLPDCKKDNDGELMFIRSEVSLRICSDKKWRAVTQDRDGKMNFTCSTKPLADSSGLKIICGGDSIGVVLNGINGTNGKNGESVRGTNGKNGENGTSCTAVSLADSTGMKIICGQDSMGVVYNGFNGTNGSNGESCTAAVLDDLSGMKIVCGKDSVGVVYNGKNGTNGENGTGCELMELDEISLRIDCGEMSATIQLNDAFKIMAITNKTITGVAQFKEPSFIGSSVFLYELDGTTLATTGRVFKGKVTGDNGEYSIPNVSLVSQYALLGVGTGENALVDLSNRTVVNINVMTSLEIDRVRYLVKEGMSFAVAKKQAESEILNAFGITDELNEPEEMNILGLEKGDSVLYAISNLVGGFMNEIEIDFEKNGKLDDEKRKVQIADDIVWKSDNLVKYPYINQNLSNIYGLGKCDADNEGLIKVNTNSLSSYFESEFLCADKIWRLASDKEKDTYGWAAGKEGDCRWGNVNTDWCYVFEKSRWSKSKTMNCLMNMVCNESNKGKYGQVSDGEWYICKNDNSYNWVKSSDVEVDTYGWTPGQENECKWGNVNTDKCYCYDLLGGWEERSSIEKCSAN